MSGKRPHQHAADAAAAGRYMPPPLGASFTRARHPSGDGGSILRWVRREYAIAVGVGVALEGASPAGAGTAVVRAAEVR